MSFGDIDDSITGYNIEGQRFLAEKMFPRLEHLNGLLGVERSRSHKPHGIEIGMPEQRGKIFVYGHIKIRRGPLPFGRHRAGSGYECDARNSLG
jgi:hypothetical protein